MKTDTPRPILLKDYRPPSYLIDKVELNIVLDPKRTRVDAKLAMRPNPAVESSAREPLRLDGEHLELARIALDGRELGASAFLADDTGLTLLDTPDRAFTLETVTYIDPDANTALQGIYRSRGVYCSQCEAEGFRRITYFLDRPDVLSVYTVRLEADAKACPVLLANGNPVERGTLKSGERHYAVWKDPHPKPCYLFAVVGGDLSSIAASFTTRSKRHVDLRIYVEHGKEERAHWAMDALKRSFAWDERRFGREYDLDVFNIVAVSDFNMGAMENKGLNIFNDRLILASSDTATDASYEAIESVVAHEYFHNWTGNRITCRDWFQLCLKEGLTVYRDQEFSGDERSPTVQRISDVRQLKALQFPEDQGPMAHPVRPETYIEINNFYTPTVYEKGAELVRMIQIILGPKGFRAGMDLYFNRHDGDAATIEDFIRCFEDATKADLSHFARWYAQAGTPELICELKYDAAAKAATLTVNQSLSPTPGQPKKEPLYIPLRLGLLGPNGHDLTLQLKNGQTIENGVVAVTERTQSFKFVNIPARPVPSLLRGFSAPVNLTIDMPEADLAFLMMHDSDLFNRWQAANQYATRTILAGLEAPDAIASAAKSYAQALTAALSDSGLDEAYKAELLKLPTQSDIAREKRSNVDHAVIDRAHSAFARAVASELETLLCEVYQAAADRGPFTPDAKSAGRRALRNAALTLLTSRAGASDLARLETHFITATNMTDQAHAMMLLAHHDVPARTRALSNFFERWKDDHLVIDTWFAAQAQSSLPATLDAVSELCTSPLFKITTPNKVRALIGTFAMSNPLQFNRPDGEGYRFVADKVLQIDAVNPQVAARLLGSFRSFKALEPKRRELAEAALRSVSDSPRISRDVAEIVLRMLES